MPKQINRGPIKWWRRAVLSRAIHASGWVLDSWADYQQLQNIYKRKAHGTWGLYTLSHSTEQNFFFGHVALQDLSLQPGTRDWTWALAGKSPETQLWATKELLGFNSRIQLMLRDLLKWRILVHLWPQWPDRAPHQGLAPSTPPTGFRNWQESISRRGARGIAMYGQLST